MKAAQTGGPDYDARIRRSRYLPDANPFADEVRTFYQRLASFQKDFYGTIRSSGKVPANPGAEGQLRAELKLGDFLRQFPELLSLLQRVGPPPMAGACLDMSV